MSKLKSFLPYLLIILSLLGVLDAAYLTFEHFAGIVPPCSIHWWLTDCGKVLGSKYSMFFGIIPLALLGVFQYIAELALSIFIITTGNKLAKLVLFIFSSAGLLFSIYFVYLMLGVIGAICLYCFASAIISLGIFVATLLAYPQKSIPVIK